jgi:hypothetical protein
MSEEGHLNRYKNKQTSPLTAYPDLPPPSYEEAQGLPSMRMEDDKEHTMGNWDYNPIYPYYGYLHIILLV